MPSNKVRDALLGMAAGDALGVPHEFRPRHELERFPVTGMDSSGTWNQAAGTWSDDSSLAFCLAETLSHGYDLRDLADRFIACMDNGYWTARGSVFGMGRATEAAIDRLRSGDCHPANAGLKREQDNGNGSLMRILPAVFHVRFRAPAERAWIVSELSSVTHGHRRSQIACIIYVEIALRLLAGDSIRAAYRDAVADLSVALSGEPEAARFQRILSGSIVGLDQQDVLSTGYVVDTLEAALWALLSTSDYRSAALAAVNLGGDTDTVAAVAGGLAGIAYGAEGIPADWLASLARLDDIEGLAARLAAATGY
ncbi:MAG: hypothetical protein A2Z99_03970 [Treponema sp. GWB1_62_6]|nr:MAG: hypothetical protein A2Y36_17240 [Treponema sp. GWA1_62_8]OHE69497.1 MAG: hypothetical protein A2001_19995 [Treponema sp. GWC1_61_84]OHE72440.1 MAG: hypothetical protein A2Z99_03970 [Treponema sp. GWB1_62_6]OHE74928.1 MAG: hypothetical protein A2413_11870 [Treponema sp. RIFOXYC1_FULL_61_9]HCM24961.1 hypothetical protein [Treponema sp.]